jgi:hypothetical protein
MLPGEPTLFNSKRLTVQKKKVVPTKHGEAAVLLTFKVNETSYIAKETYYITKETY